MLRSFPDHCARHEACHLLYGVLKPAVACSVGLAQIRISPKMLPIPIPRYSSHLAPRNADWHADAKRSPGSSAPHCQQAGGAPRDARGEPGNVRTSPNPLGCLDEPLSSKLLAEEPHEELTRAGALQSFSSCACPFLEALQVDCC